MSQHAGNATQSSPPGVGPRLLPGAEARRAGLVKSLRAGDWAWLGVTAVVAAYEIAASSRRHDWELLSEACDRYRTRHPVVVSGAIVYLAAHLTRVMPDRIDPLHRIGARRG
jgi:hypothetical protein